MRKETKNLKNLLPNEKRDEKFGKAFSPLRKEMSNLEKPPPH
jgi:hypothetical protein